MTYVVKKEGKRRYVVRHRYTRQNTGRACTTPREAQSRADRLNREQQSARPRSVFAEEGAARA